MRKRALTTMWPYWLVCGLVFYVPMLLAAWCKIGGTGFLMVLLLVIMPVTCFVESLVFALRHKFHMLFSVGVMVLFVPVVLLFMDGLRNSTGWVYTPVYFTVSLVGCALGHLLHR